MAQLVVFSNGEEFRVPLGGQPVTIGREASNTISLDDPRCSRKHARVESTAGGIMLTDLQSSNGTYVGMERITAVVLADGDVFNIGEVRITLESPAPPTMAGAAPQLPPDANTMVEEDDDDREQEYHLTFADSPPSGKESGPVDFGVPVDTPGAPPPVPPAGPRDPHVEFITGKQEGDVVPLEDRDAWFIGSDVDTDIHVRDSRVEPIHAALRLDASGRFFLSDSGSATGTYVNGKFIVSETELKHGDVLKLGESALRFNLYADKKPRKRKDTGKTSRDDGKGKKGFLGKLFG